MANNYRSYVLEEEIVVEEDAEEEEDDDEEEDEDDDEDDQDYAPRIREAEIAQNPQSNPAQPIVLEDDDDDRGEVTVPPFLENGERRIEEEEEEYVMNKRRRKREEEEASSSTVRNGNSIENDTDGTCCPICMEPWTSCGPHEISCLLCGHIYGRSCIEKWIRQCGRSSAKCPQCNRKCILKDVRKLYASQVVVADEDLQKKVFSLQAEVESLRAENGHLRLENECLNKTKESSLGNALFGVVHRMPSEFIATTGVSHGETASGFYIGSNVGRQRSLCRFKLKDELGVEGARIFDMNASSQMLILARRHSGMGGMHVLTKMSLLYPYENENVPLPPSTKAVRDLHFSPFSDRLVLLASLGKKLSIFSMESNNMVHTYDLPTPAWSCSWDLNCSNHIYAGLQNGMILVFDVRQTARPIESICGLTCHPVHTIHSLVHNSTIPNGVRTLLSASSVGPCVWNTSGVGERPFLLPEMENQGVCISLAYCPTNDDIIATYRPKVQVPNETVSSQPSLSPPPTVRGQGISGSHVLFKRVNGNCYQKLGSTSANVNDVRMPKSAIINVAGCRPLFAYGDESRGLSLWELPSLTYVQSLKDESAIINTQSIEPHQHPIFDVKYRCSQGMGILGCVSENKLQLYSPNIS